MDEMHGLFKQNHYLNSHANSYLIMNMVIAVTAVDEVLIGINDSNNETAISMLELIK